MQQLLSFAGLLIMLALAWLMSSARSRVCPRMVIAGLLLQFGLALVILKTAAGRAFFEGIGRFFAHLLDCVNSGSRFVFGESFSEHFFAFKALPTVIFFSALMSVLYHLGIVQRVVSFMAWCMQKALNTSGAETLSTATNVFVGHTEAPLVVRPYIDHMTRSELMALMVGGFATVSGGVLAAYVDLGISAGHLVMASVISAPAALLVAKVLEPELADPVTLGTVKIEVPRTSTNLIEAAATGAADGAKLAINIAAMLIAFLALIAVVDASLLWLGHAVGRTLGVADWQSWDWSLTNLLGYLFAPLAFVMGIPWSDCLHAGQLLGKKMVANEFVAYAELGQWLTDSSRVPLQPRTVTILTYALCGFANFSSIGIQIGGIGGIAPARRTELAQLGLRAMLGGTLAAFMTACVAGMLI